MAWREAYRRAQVMNQPVREILEHLAEFERTPQAFGQELRLSVAQLVLGHLRQRGWTQSYLAAKAGLSARHVREILHSNTNCTLDTVGKLLHALGIHARLKVRVA